MSLGLECGEVAALFVQAPQKPGRGRKRGIRSPYLDLLPKRCWAREVVTRELGPDQEGPHERIAFADATNYTGPWAVVAHPPCRAWGKFAHFETTRNCIREGERGLAAYALLMVRRCGGVMEHPEGSRAWDCFGLPKPLAGCGGPVRYGSQFSLLHEGGFSLAIDQFRFGHRCKKQTWLYIHGVPLPIVMGLIPPPREGNPTHTIASVGIAKGGLPQVSRYEREHTPLAFAEFLIEIARRCQP